MGSFGGYYKGEKKKPKRDTMEKKASHIEKISVLPQVEILGKGKGKK